MRSFLNNVRSYLIGYFYLLLDKTGFSRDNAFILMFHHVTNEDIDASPACLCSIEHFTKILEFLKSNQIEVVSIEDALKKIKGKYLKNYAAITFDDGLIDTYTIAFPLLKDFNFPFTVYITYNYINTKGYISYKQLDILNNEPLCTIASHSLSHPVLMTNPNARFEIVQSKSKLESLLNKKVKHFAYPYGGPPAVSLRNIMEVKKAGYESAVSSLETKLNFFSTLIKFYLPRVNGSFFLLHGKR